MDQKISDDTEPKHEAPPTPVKRKYNGLAKGSAEAKERMERVRAAQWAKNGLVQSAKF